jgi:hypothetical protein
MTPEDSPLAAMTDADLEAMLRRALRLVVILGVILAVVLTVVKGWQTGLLEVTGAAISWTGIHEWKSLALTVFARLDNRQPPRPMGRTLGMFFLRLGAVAAVLYASLRCLHGSVYALVAGIALSIVALSIEALRLLRG